MLRDASGCNINQVKQKAGKIEPSILPSMTVLQVSAERKVNLSSTIKCLPCHEKKPYSIWTNRGKGAICC